jgi:hypothetical protein
MKAISSAFAWAGAWLATTATVWAGVAPPPPSVESDSGNEGLILLALIGVVIFAATKGKGKAEAGAPAVVDDASGADDGKY